MRIVVLASGRGSNLKALIDAERSGDLPVRVAGVISDRISAGALALAREAGVPALHLDPRLATSRLAYDLELFAKIAEWSPQLIVLAGFMRILDPLVLAPWLGRIINIHPSLLPRYPGLHTHQRALESGDTRHGASVHFVTAELDGGPVLAQAVIDILPGDTPDTLAARLLPREHELLVASIGCLASGQLSWSGSQTCWNGQPLREPLLLAEDGSLRPARPC